MNTRPKFHVLMARHVGSDLLLTHSDVHTDLEYSHMIRGTDVVWAKLIVAATGMILAWYDANNPAGIKNPA